MAAGNDFCGNPLWNTLFHPASTDAERGIPVVGKIVTRTDVSPPELEMCVDVDPDPDDDGGGTWAPIGNNGLTLAGNYTNSRVTFTPTLTATSVNPTGLTIAEGFYKVSSNGDLFARYRFVFGSGMTAGTGTYEIGLPVSGVMGDWAIGAGHIVDNSTGTRYACTVTGGSSADKARLVCDAGVVAATVPWTWAQYDELHLFIYCDTQ